MTDLRVRKRQAFVTVMLANGQTTRGSFFLSESAADHAGPQRIDDLLNTSERFVLFHVDADTGLPRIITVHVVSDRHSAYS